MPNMGKKVNAYTILLVDDDEMILKSMSRALEVYGYNVIRAENGLQALDVLAHTERLPIVIVLDMSMPVMDGKGFLKRRANDPTIKKIPVIVVSGNDPPKEPLQDVKAYLQKPVAVEELVSQIESTAAWG